MQTQRTNKTRTKEQTLFCFRALYLCSWTFIWSMYINRKLNRNPHYETKSHLCCFLLLSCWCVMSATCAADERVLSSGIYNFQVVMGNGSSWTLKLIKHKSVSTLAFEWTCCVLGLMANYIILHYTCTVLYYTNSSKASTTLKTTGNLNSDVAACPVACLGC